MPRRIARLAGAVDVGDGLRSTFGRGNMAERADGLVEHGMCPLRMRQAAASRLSMRGLGEVEGEVLEHKRYRAGEPNE